MADVLQQVAIGLLGIVLGVAGDRAFLNFAGKRVKQRQQAGNFASQVQVGIVEAGGEKAGDVPQ